MRRCLCCKLRLCSLIYSTWWMKLLAVLFLMGWTFYALRYNYHTQNSVFAVKSNSLVDHQAYYNWHCEVNKRMLSELQKELKEKNKLLNYRGKVIMTLRSTVKKLNSSNIRLMTYTLFNQTKTITHRNISSKVDTKLMKAGNFTTINNLSSFEQLKFNAARASRPCCMALNRMTDILREYMESNQELRERVNDLRHVNITRNFEEYAKLYKVHENFTKRAEKYSVYQTFSDNFFYETIPLNRMDPKQKIKSKTFRKNYDFRYAAQVAIRSISKKMKLDMSLFEINDSLLRYDELKGAVYRLVFSYNKTRKITSDVLKPYASYITSNVQISDLHPPRYELINVIVPISNRTNRLVLFLENIRNLTKYSKENIFLTIVIYGGDPSNQIKNKIKSFSKHNNFTGYDILKRNLPFNRGRALHEGIMRWNGYPNVLMFLCDIDIKIQPEFFNRCRQNVKLGSTVYMPIVFSLYNPSIVFRNNVYRSDVAFNISESTGTWRPYGYGMVCLYKPDYLRIGGYNLKIDGWGGEDYSLYIRFLKKRFHVIRAPDPGLFHLWHAKKCSQSLNKRQYETCLGSKARYEGSQRQLGILLFSKNLTLENKT